MSQAAESVPLADEPELVHGAAVLSRRILSGEDLGSVGAELHALAIARPESASALMDLATLLYLKRDDTTASAVQRLALELSRFYRLRITERRGGVSLLVVMAPGDLATNTPLDYLVLDSDITLDMLYVGPGLELPHCLPPHDAVFVAIGEADETREARSVAEKLCRSTSKPVLNAAERIGRVSREQSSELLASARGVLMPVVKRISAATLRTIATGVTAITTLLPDGAFPILVRPVGSHSGKGLAKLHTADSVAGYLAGQATTERDFYVSHFVDYRQEDGLYRKARIVLIQGRPFACHLAVAEDWMLHYQTAGMTESAAKRSEEAQFMAEFETGFAQRHERALRAVSERIGLDYLIVDCAETRDGRLLIFEVDSNALVHALDPVDLFPYKQPVMREAFRAFRAMLESRALRGVPSA